MLLHDFIKIDITDNNLNYYKIKNTDLSVGDRFIIKVDDLGENSGYKVDVKCDYCGVEFKTEYRKYLRSIGISKTNSCKSSKCSKLKVKDSNIIKYGIENVMQLESSKIKAKKSNLDRWGTENPNELEVIKDKIKKTNINRYGSTSYIKTKEFKIKSKKSNLDRWGTENPNELEVIKNKIKETSLKKWGVENYTQTDEYKIKSKKTSFKKWGVENYTKTDEYKNKIKKHNFERWGSETIQYSEEYRKENYKIAQHPNYIKFIISEKCSEFKCDCGEDHNFILGIDNFYHRIKYSNPLCTICYPIGDSKSIKEVELYKFINNLYNGDIIQSYRDGLEIDIYLPELKIGFEFNGLYWHSNLYKNKEYHLEKLEYFSERGIRIVNIWEDDWNLKNEIIKSQIKNIIGVTNNRIFARNCKVKEVKNIKEVRRFLDKNHIQGFVNSKVKLGLYCNEDLVSLMLFDQFEGRKKMYHDDWNLSRFCNKLDINVVGGASKLLSYFIKNYSTKRIISYADKDWSNGNLYEKIGFIKISENKPDYKYITDGRRVHKSRFRKSFTGLSESKINIPKIWDCGKIKFELIL